MGIAGRDLSLRGAPRGSFSKELYDEQCILRDYYNTRRNDYTNIIEKTLIMIVFFTL